MRVLLAALALILAFGAANAQDAPLTGHRDSTIVCAGFGTTILPTTVLASRRLGDGGGGFVGGNITVGVKVTHDFGPHWRVPLSLSLGFLRGSEEFWHRDVIAPGDTVGIARSLTNTANVSTFQVGAEYYEEHELVSPYVGADVAFMTVGQTTLDLSIPARGIQILHQTLPAVSRIGLVLRAGAELPIYEQLYYDVSAEVGAFNLFGRSSGDKPEIGQLFVPTQLAFDQYKARTAEDKSGEDVVTYIRILLKLGWKF